MIDIFLGNMDTFRPNSRRYLGVPLLKHVGVKQQYVWESNLLLEDSCIPNPRLIELVGTRREAAEDDYILSFLKERETEALIGNGEERESCTTGTSTAASSLSNSYRDGIEEAILREPLLRSPGRDVVGSTWRVLCDGWHIVSCALDNHQSRSMLPELEMMDTNLREKVITWIGHVVYSMNWPLSCFFIAVHALDYVTMNAANSAVTAGGIPLLATACVLMAVSTECNRHQLEKTKTFVGQVPTVESVHEIVCMEMSVIAALNRGTLLNKTPVDFIMLYLAGMTANDEEISKAANIPSFMTHMWHATIRLDATLSTRTPLVDYILCRSETKGAKIERVPLVEAIIELSLTISFMYFLKKLYFFTPISRVIAAVFLDVLTHTSPLFSKVDFATTFCHQAFLLDFQADLASVWKILPSIYRECLRNATGGRSKSSEKSYFLNCSGTTQILLENLLLSDMAQILR